MCEFLMQLPRTPGEADSRGNVLLHCLEPSPRKDPLYESSRRFVELERRVASLEEKFRVHDIVEGTSIINGEVMMWESARHDTSMLAKHEGDVNCTPSEPMDECENSFGGFDEQTDAPTQASMDSMDSMDSIEPRSNIDSMDTYVFADTVWEAVLVLGHPEISPVSAILLLFCVFVNVAGQIFICVAFVRCDAFIPPEGLSKYTPLIDSMHRWRLTDGHKLNSLDLGGVNLVSRVCNGDSALSFGDRQARILSVINSYLGIDDSLSEEISPLPWGPCLSMACIFCYSLVVLAELRRVSRLVFALLAIPMAQRTRFDNQEIVSISFRRLTLIFFTVIVRVGIAGLLLCEGTIWLSTTNDISELLLNTAALFFVLEVDELLFHAMLPAAVQSVLITLKPLRYRRARWNLESILAFVCAFVVIYLAYSNLMLNNIDTMLQVRHAICGGFKEFVSAKTSIGVMAAHRSTKASEAYINPRYDLRSVQELIDSEDAPFNAVYDLSIWFGTRIDVFQEFYKYPIDQYAKLPCSDSDSFPLLRTTMRYVVNTVNAIAAEQNKMVVSETFICSAYRHLCDDLEHTLLRAFCPSTCGCDVSTSGFSISEDSLNYGCPSACREIVYEQVRNASCTDLPVTGNSPQDSSVRIAWKGYWQAVTLHVEKRWPTQVDVFRNFSNRKIANGCKDTSLDPVGNQNFCNEHASFPSYLGVRSIIAFCPRTCCQGSGAVALLDECPAACHT